MNLADADGVRNGSSYFDGLACSRLWLAIVLAKGSECQARCFIHTFRFDFDAMPDAACVKVGYDALCHAPKISNQIFASPRSFIEADRQSTS